MKKNKAGFAFHVHHDRLFEWCFDYDERVKAIEQDKPKHEQELRLRLFKLIPLESLPKKLVKAGEACAKAWEAYAKAWEAYNKAREAYDKAGEAYEPELIELHKQLCPDCPWDGNTIFSKENKDGNTT